MENRVGVAGLVRELAELILKGADFVTQLATVYSAESAAYHSL